MYERLETNDGSFTYLNKRVEATYRSVNGAETEARYIFLDGTRLEARPSIWRVLELGVRLGVPVHRLLRRQLVQIKPAPLKMLVVW